MFLESLDPAAGVVGAVLGILVSKLFDWFMRRGRDQVEVLKVQRTDLTEAEKALRHDLFEQLTSLRGQYHELLGTYRELQTEYHLARHEHEEVRNLLGNARTELESANARIDRLEKIVRLRNSDRGEPSK